jgi:hypothetical protein
MYSACEDPESAFGNFIGGQFHSNTETFQRARVDIVSGLRQLGLNSPMILPVQASKISDWKTWILYRIEHVLEKGQYISVSKIIFDTQP